MSRAEQVKARMARELQQAELADQLEQELPEGYPWSISPHKLYGSVAGVSIKPENHRGAEERRYLPTLVHRWPT